MKWFRRKKALAALAPIQDSDSLLAPGVYRYTADGSLERVSDLPKNSPSPLEQLAAQKQIPAEIREDIDKALAEFPFDKVREARFFGVPMDMFTKEELIQIISWVGMNARDHRRDS